MQFWKTKAFRVQIKHWNQKLEETGFVDAEVELKGDRALKQKSTNSYRQATELERESRLGYYRLLGHLASNTQFENELESLIMLRHADGATIKEIVQEINSKGLKFHRRTVGYIIRRWQMKWGIKSWTLTQMNLKKTRTA